MRTVGRRPVSTKTTPRVVLRFLAAIGVMSLFGCQYLEYLKGPQDRTSDPKYAWLVDQCIELSEPTYVAHVSVVTDIPEEKTRLTFTANRGLYPMPDASAWPAAKGKRIGSARVLDLLAAGTRLRVRRIVEIRTDIGPRAAILVESPTTPRELYSLGDLELGSFPETSMQPLGGSKVVDCDAPASVPPVVPPP